MSSTKRKKKSYTEEYLELMGEDWKPSKSAKNSYTEAYLEQMGEGWKPSYTAPRSSTVASSSGRDEDIAPVKKKSDDGEDSWFQSGAFKDGYQFGDVTKTIIGTLHDVNENITTAVFDATENLIDTTAYGVGLIGGLFDEDFKDDVGKFIAKEILEPTKSGEDVATYGNPTGWLNLLVNDGDTEENSVLGNKADSLVQSGSHLVGSYALQMVGVPAWLTQGVNAFGSEIESAFQQDATFSEAGISGGISAAAEIVFERISSGIKFKGGTLDEGLQNWLKNNISNKVGRTITKYAVDMVGEGTEEVLTEAASAVGRKMTYLSDEEWEDVLSSEDMFDAFIGGAVMSGVAGGGKIVKSAQTGRDYVTGLNASEERVVNKVLDDAIEKAESRGTVLTTREKNKLYDSIVEQMDKGQLDIDDIESVLGGKLYQEYKNTIDAEDALKAELDELRQMESGKMNDIQKDRLAELKGMNLEDTTKRDALRQQLNDTVFPLVKDSRLANTYNERAQRGQAFEANLTKYTGKQKEAVERAVKSGVLNNTYQSHVLVDTLSRLEAEKGIVFDYTNNAKLKESGFAIEGKTVNGFVKDGSVTLNVQSNQAWQFVVGHEVTHILEGTEAYNELRNVLFEYAKSIGELDSRRATLTGLYNNVNADIDAELTADLVGDYLFTDENFIKNLTGNRTLFQKVWAEIKYLCKVATGKQLTEIEKVERAFNKAWKEYSHDLQAKEFSDGEVKYSIREEAPPKKTIKGYKVFKVVDGKLYPPMVDNPSGNGTPVGVWLNADIGGLAHNKDGSVKLNTKGRFAVESSQGGSLAFRPGWHLGEYPDASQFGRTDKSRPLTEEEIATYEGKTYKDKKTGNVYPMNLFPYNFVWAECEVAADRDYQLDAMSLGVNEKGAFNRTQAGLPYVPTDGYYKYRTNPDPNTAPWIIAGAMKVNRILSDAEVAEICAQHGVTPQTREGYTNLKVKDGGSRMPSGAINLEDFGLAEGDVIPTDADTLAEIAEADGLAKERSATTMELLKTLPGYAKRKINFSDKKIIEEFGRNNQDVEYYRGLAESTSDGYLADDNLYSEDAVKYSISKDSDGNELSPAVQKRFANSKAVDENGDLKVLYHGTYKGEFYTFDKSKGSVQGDFGSGFYFTDNESDADVNYVGGGPDYNNKIDMRAAEIEAEEDIDYYEAEERAKEEIYVGAYKHRVYANIENPAIVGETYLLEYDSYMEQVDRADYDSDEDYESDVEQLIADEIDSIIWDIQRNVDVDSTDGIAEVLWNAINEGGIGIEQLKANINNLYLEDSVGNIVGNEVTRQIIESLGYDGIIDNTVSTKFNMGLDEGTTHYIVFKPNQIKDISNQNPTDNPDIRYSLSDIAPANREPIISKLTGREISEQTYATLDKLERGEAATLEELDALPEVIEGADKVEEYRNEFLSDHPELKDVPASKLGTHLIDSAEREQLRNSILEERLKSGSFTSIDKKGKEVYNGSVEKGKRLDIVIGLAAAGKSTSIVNPLSQYYKSVVVDSDIIKGQLPEFNEGWGASLVHEESSAINMRMLDEELARGNNIVLPIVGAKTSSVEKYVRLAKASEYEVHLHLNELNSSKAMGRMLRRYFSQGRFIPPEISWKNGDKPTSVFEEMKNRGDISGYSHWNNDVARGQRPTLIGISEGNRALGEYSRAWRAVRGTDDRENDSQTASGETQTNEIAPVKETSSADGVFFDANNEASRVYSLSNEGEQPSTKGTPLSDLALEGDIAPIAETTEEIPMPTDEDLPFTDIPSTKKANAPVTLEAIQTELANVKELRSDAYAKYEQKIAQKQAELDSKKNKDTKVAHNLRMQIERLKRLRDSTDAKYAKRIDSLETREQLTREGKPTTREQHYSTIVSGVKTAFSDSGLDFDDVLKNAKNLSTFSTVDNTPQRVMEKALGYKEGQVLADLTVNKVAQNETEGIKWLNSFTDRKNGLLAQISREYRIKPGSKESAAAQMYAEGFYVNENNDIIAYGDAELAQDFPDAKVQSSIKGLARDPRIRQIYDETLAAINESRTRNAYPEIKKLDNYFLHFRAMDDTFSKLGLPFNPNDIRAKDLPTDLNGVTADLKPGQPYFASSMHRKGKRTSFDLLGGLERYLTSAKNQIYHIDDIQTLRALRNYIADTYGQANGLEGIDSLSEEEAQERIEKVYSSHLSTFAKFLNEEANVLAGKTALIDRGLEGVIGRRGMTFLDTVNKQVGSNMVGFNISSSLTNFIPVAQTFAKSNKFDFVKAFAQTVSNKFGSIVGKSDGFAENSPVIIRRKGADRFYRTPFQKVGDAGYVLMSAVDNISTELIARTKYNELTRKGMSEQQAHFETDKWVSRLMGDRSLGQQPQLYNSKTLGIITKFQLEVRNQLDSQFYDTIQEAKASNEDIENGLARNAKTAAKITSTFVQLAIAQHLFGKAFESVAGYNPAFDIISVLATMFGLDDEEDSEDTAWDNIEQGFLELAEDLPYTSSFTGGGRIPISSALPLKQLVQGKDNYGNEKSRWEILGETAPYYVLPGGYGQIKKTYQGLNMFNTDEEHPIAGSYTNSGNLRFPVEDTPLNRVQAGIFGQYASKNAREYFDNDYAPLKEKQIQEYIDADIPISDYWKYRKGLSGLKTNAEKLEYISGLDIPIDAKNVFANNIIDRDEPVDVSDYGDYGSYKEFMFAKNYPEKYQFLKDNNISFEEYSKDDEQIIFTSGESREAYDWAFEHQGGYEMAKVIAGDVITYKQYTGDMYNLKADKDENGKSISGSKKEKVIDYINNLDIDYGQRIILFKSQYKSDDTYDADIINYLNNRNDLTYESRVAILTELGFKVTSDGQIYSE